MPETSLPAELPDSDRWAHQADGPIPFGRFAAEVLELYRPPLRAKATYSEMRRALRLLGELVGPDATTSALTPALIARLIAARPPEHSANTTRTLLVRVKVICSYAHSQGYVRSNAMSFRKNWLRAAPSAAKKHHSIGEIRRVLDLASAEVESSSGWARWRARRMRAMVTLFAYTGLRRDEGLNLRVEDLDFGDRMIRLAERGGRFKTEASAQSVPMAGPLAEALWQWLPHRLDRPEVCHPGPPDCPWLIPNLRRTNRWKDGGVGVRPIDQLKALGERAGVQGLTFQSFRHSFATHGEHWGLSPAMIQRILRHTSQQTQKHYRHADEPNMRAAIGKVDFGPCGAEGEARS